MKDENDAVCRPMADTATDEFLAERKFNVTAIGTDEMVTKLGCEMVTSVYANIGGCRGQREAGTTPTDARPESQTNVRAKLGRLIQHLVSLERVKENHYAIWMTTQARPRHGIDTINPRNSPSFGGKLGPPAGLMLAFHRKETCMNHPVSPPQANVSLNPLARLDAMIVVANAEIAAAQADVDVATAEIEAIEPHPHAHGYTAGGDCIYASIGPDHFLPLAGLLARPWPATLGTIETFQQRHAFDYLLKAVPAAIVDIGETLADDGIKLINARRHYLDQDLSALYRRKPELALGMVWLMFGFHRRDRHAWVGAFAYGERLSALIGSTDGITDTISLGDALAAAVAAHPVVLSSIGLRELHRRAASRDAERQASWAEVPESYREAGPWRGWAPSKRQRHLMQRIEEARCLPTTATGRRGATSDWITTAGGNPRFDTSNGEQA